MVSAPVGYGALDGFNHLEKETAVRRTTIFLMTLALAGCKATDTTIAPLPEGIPMTFSVTDKGVCTVQIENHTYTSVGQVRYDSPPAFIGTIQNMGYHGFSCWVGTPGGDGEIKVVFAGDNYGKPLAVGKYIPRLEFRYDEPGFAWVTFRSAMLGTRLLQTYDAQGSVDVTATSDGGRVITGDLRVLPLDMGFSLGI
ncbi:MAG TPA: hypothetical protein VIF83_14830 [Gemmatimonadaceae bacterium]|jgi:hypothetical protein